MLLTIPLLVGLAAASPWGGYAANPEYTYSYSSGLATGKESRAGGLTVGAFSYVDANGQVQRRSYKSEGAQGFVVTATDAQEPVQDTPEVARAKQEHLAAVAHAKALVSASSSSSSGAVGAAAVAAAVPQPVADTPEVAAARALHLAIVQDARAQGSAVSVTPAPVHAVASWSTPSTLYAAPPQQQQQQHVWGVSSTPAPVQDTVEVAAAKAKHLAAVEEAKSRVAAASSGASSFGSYSAGVSSAYSQQQLHQHNAYAGIPASPVEDTAEVAAAKAQHLAAVAQAAARVSPSQPTAPQYAVPDAAAHHLHYPNVPADLAPRYPAPAAAPAWPATFAVRYKTVASVDDASGRYFPDDEGRYLPGNDLDAEGQYDTRLDAEGQYDQRYDAEGQYVPSLNDEGQWVPSANEGQYVAGREDESEDNMPYSYSYSDGLSTKTETKTTDGVTRGRFSYVDANRVLQAREYEADNVNGFRVVGTNLPQAPATPAAAVTPGARIYHPPAPAYPAYPAPAYRAPVPTYRTPIAAYGVPSQHIQPIAAAYAAPAVAVSVPDVPADTPEVAAAKAAHFAAHREAGARLASAYSG